MNKFSIIEVNDPRWSEIVKKSKHFDFYHSRCYHLLEKENRPVLLVAFFSDDFIALPLIVRVIPNTSFYDCTSVYGYCGPISSLEFEDIPLEKITYFKEQLMNFFESNGIVTVFSRLHPLISTDDFFDNFGLIKHINYTVAIDLRLTLEQQRAQFRKSNKNELNQLRRNGFEVVEAKTKEDVDAFIDIYYETMCRNHACENYFFDHSYFYNFLENECFESKLLVAKKEGEITAGAIITIVNRIMQGHLAGTAEKYLHDKPMKLIIDETRLIGNELGLDFYHLGGGLAGSDEDSLFLFKAGFSDYRCEYKIWQMVVDQGKYNELINGVEVDKNISFFPLYRAFEKEPIKWKNL
ncbi:hypothetical protein D3C84_414610 [compost metagenome]